MRFSRLLPLLSQHLGDFPARLAQRCGLVWEYLPSPPISYPELTNELWCHRWVREGKGEGRARRKGREGKKEGSRPCLLHNGCTC
jgi:hypothetical protein